MFYNINGNETGNLVSDVDSAEISSKETEVNGQ